jgi:hypothetical protein
MKVESFKCIKSLLIVMNKPKILMLGIAVAISLFSVANLSSAFAQTETEGFTAMLSGGEEVPPVTTESTGVASFNVTGPEAIEYSVNVTGMDKVTAAHIHSGATGENGEVVVTLFKADSPTGQISGNLANGTITGSSLEGQMQGTAVSDLVKAMERGETYVNVHTEANPNGEIRGQVKAGQ